MPRNKRTPEEIVSRLQQVDVLASQGSPMISAIQQIPRGREDEDHLRDDLAALVREYGRLGYRKMAARLRSTLGGVVNDKRVERIWRHKGLKVPPRQQKRSRIYRKHRSSEVIDILPDLVILRGVPEHIRLDNGHGLQAEFHWHGEDQGIRLVKLKIQSAFSNRAHQTPVSNCERYCTMAAW